MMTLQSLAGCRVSIFVLFNKLVFQIFVTSVTLSIYFSKEKSIWQVKAIETIIILLMFMKTLTRSVNS